MNKKSEVFTLMLRDSTSKTNAIQAIQERFPDFKIVRECAGEKPREGQRVLEALEYIVLDVPISHSEGLYSFFDSFCIHPHDSFHVFKAGNGFWDLEHPSPKVWLEHQTELRIVVSVRGEVDDYGFDESILHWSQGLSA